VLQSIGRGVRIEPLKNVRRRLEVLYINSQVDKSTYKQVEAWITPIESLFVFGTKANNLETILQILREQRSKERALIKAESNLFSISKSKHHNHKFTLHPEDKELARDFLEIDDKVLVCMFDANPRVLAKLRRDFDALVSVEPTERKIGIPEVVFKKLLNYFSHLIQKSLTKS
jgi:hypothetical protein